MTLDAINNITEGQETSWREYCTRLAAILGLPKSLSLLEFVIIIGIFP
jgi:hypothetical protein